MSFHIGDYNLHDLIQLFHLKATPATLSVRDIEQAQMKIQQSEKKGHLSSENLLFFHQALHVLKTHVKTIVEKAPISTIVENKSNDKFNHLFENTVQTEKILEQRRRHNQWFQSSSQDEPTIEKGKSVDEIHTRMDSMRRNIRESNGVQYNPTGVTNAASFFDDEEENEAKEIKYISSNGSLKYDDIRRVHRDQLIIPVKTLNKEYKTISLEKYKSEREQDTNPIDSLRAQELFQMEELQKQREYQIKRDRVLKQWDKNSEMFQKNYDILK